MSAATKAKISAALKARNKAHPRPKKRTKAKLKKPPQHHRVEVFKGKPTTPGHAVASGTTVRSILKRRAKRK
jgi:hypothetical protein